jgi:hypothetical protein
MTWDDAAVSPRSRSRWALLAGAAVLVVAVAFLAGGQGEATQARDPEVLEVTTAEPEDLPLPEAPGEPRDEATAVPRPTPSETVSPTASPSPAPTPLVGGAGPISVFTAVAEYGASSLDLSVQRIDPATGITMAAEVSFEDRFSSVLAALGDGLVVMEGGNAVRYSTDLRRGEVLSPADGMFGVPSGARVWLLDGQPFGGELAAYSVTASGAPGPGVSLPGFARPVGAIEQGLVVQAGPEIVLIRPDGTVGSLASGEAIATGDEAVALLRCPEALQCRVVVVDGAGADVTDVPAPAELPEPSFDLASATLSPDGSRLAFGGVFGAGGLFVLDLTSGELASAPATPARPPSSVAWTPDGSAVVADNSAGLPMYWDVGSDETVPLAPLDGNGQIFDIMILETGG